MTINGNFSVLLLRYREAPGLLRCRCPGVCSRPRLLHASVTTINTFQHDKWPWKWISAISSTSLEPFPQALAFITVWFPHFYFGRLCLCPWCNEKRWISTQDSQHRAALADIPPHAHNLYPTWRICQPAMCCTCSLVLKVLPLLHRLLKCSLWPIRVGCWEWGCEIMISEISIKRKLARAFVSHTGGAIKADWLKVSRVSGCARLGKSCDRRNGPTVCAAPLRAPLHFTMLCSINPEPLNDPRRWLAR